MSPPVGAPGAPPYLPVIAGVALITYGMRLLPGLLLAGRPLPPPVVRWMGFVPVAVLAAMVGPGLFMPDGVAVAPLRDNPALWASLPTMALAFFTRNFLATVLFSVVSMAAVRIVLATFYA